MNEILWKVLSDTAAQMLALAVFGALFWLVWSLVTDSELNKVVNDKDLR